MKVVFLDIDGVLNSLFFFRDRWREGKTHQGPGSEIDSKAVRWLNELVIRSGASVVISSSWREKWPQPEITKMLHVAGYIGSVIGMTPSIPGSQRGDEILRWCTDQGLVYGPNQFAILDDKADMRGMSSFLVQVNPGKGLKPKDVAAALDQLHVDPADFAAKHIRKAAP